MEIAEAKVYFPESDTESIEEQYETMLFQWKQYFVNRFPISKLYASKAIQLSYYEEAYSVLTGEVHKPEMVHFDQNFPGSLKEAFLHFEKERSRFRQALYSCNSISQIMTLIGVFPAFAATYASYWEFNHQSLEGIMVSKEFDPMALLDALKDAETLGVITSKDISKLPDDHLVVRESKRLSLWLKMDKNG